MTRPDRFQYFRTSHEFFCFAVMLFVRFLLSLRNVEDLLHERGFDLSHETIRFWWQRLGPIFAAMIRHHRNVRMRAVSPLRWQFDEIFVKINGEWLYLCRVIDHEGGVPTVELDSGRI